MIADLPIFIIIGAQKAGTTSLFNYLSAHPSVTTPTVKEVHFFDKHFNRGIRWYQSQFCELGSVSRQLAGEATPLYLFHPHAMRRIRESLPNCKLIALLRNPIDRAYSHYQHGVHLQYERRSFEEAIREEEPRISMEREKMLKDPDYFSIAYQRYSYLARGKYYEQLKTVFDLFPREQILVIQSEELFRTPASVTKRVRAFLGIGDTPGIDFEHHYGRRYAPLSGTTRVELAEYFAEQNGNLYNLIDEKISWD